MKFLRTLSTVIAASLLSFAFADSGEWSSQSYTNGTLLSTASVNPGARYTRLIRLSHSRNHNARLISTFENWPLPFVVYSSDDDGRSWQPLSTITEQHLLGWYAGIEPDVYELPRATGDLAAGTLLMATNVRTGPYCSHELYVSTDSGVTWKYRSTVDFADDSVPPYGIWEPNLLLSKDNRLVCFYSDERHTSEGFNQLLGMKVSTDGGHTWGAEQYVVAIPGGVERPGMAVTKELPNGTYVMSYECVGAEYMQPVRIRFSNDGINWGAPSDYGTRVISLSGSYPGATPTITYLPRLGPHGALVVTARHVANSPNSDREVFVNTNWGQGAWSVLPSPVQWQAGVQQNGYNLGGWSMGMLPTTDGAGLIQLACGGYGDNSNECVRVGRAQMLLGGAVYNLTNLVTKQKLTVPNYPNVHGVTLVQEPSTGGLDQQWTLNDLGDEAMSFTNTGNGLNVDDLGWNASNNAPLGQWDVNNLTVQQFRPVPVGDGTWMLQHVFNGRFMTPGGKGSGAGLNLTDRDGTADQHWNILPPGWDGKLN